VSSLLACGSDQGSGTTHACKADAKWDESNEDPVDDEHDLHDIASVFSIVKAIFHVSRANLASGVPSPDGADNDKSELGNRREGREETAASNTTAFPGIGKAHTCAKDTE
jgi:hypothetical protein